MNTKRKYVKKAELEKQDKKVFLKLIQKAWNTNRDLPSYIRGYCIVGRTNTKNPKIEEELQFLYRLAYIRSKL